MFSLFRFLEYTCSNGSTTRTHSSRMHTARSSSVHHAPSGSRYPLGADTPPHWEQTPPEHPPEQTPPGSRHPPGADPSRASPRSIHPPEANTSRSRHPPEQPPPPRVDPHRAPTQEQAPPGANTPEQTPLLPGADTPL